MIEAFAQARRQVVELCSQRRYSTARLFLVGAGCTVETHTSLWEYVARQSQANGNQSVARQIRREIWEAGVGSVDIALREADDALDRQDHGTAEYILETAFGSPTRNHEALRRLARSYLQQAQQSAAEGTRLRTDRETARQLAEDFTFNSPDDAAVLVDMLRFSGELSLAREKNQLAREQFGNHIKFDTREARISEQLYDLTRAAELWEAISKNSDSMRGRALLQLCSLYERLERDDDLRRSRARLAVSDVSLAERLRLALTSGQRGMARALTEHIGVLCQSRTPIPTDVQNSVAEQLLDNGEIGLVVWLRRQRLMVGDRVKRVLDDAGFSIGGSRDLPDTVDEAVRITSPAFMLPLEKAFNIPAKPKGWPGTGQEPKSILLVNVSLAIGGAERQFVQLAKSLLDLGVAPEQLNVALFSLDQDRGHAKFLPELAALGVTIHDLSGPRDAARPFTARERAVIDALPRRMREDVQALLPLVQELQPDVLHGWQDRSSVACGIVGIAASVRRIALSLRNMSPQTRQDQALLRNEGLFKEFAERDNFMISANARPAAHDYAGWLDHKPDRIDVIPNAIDLSRYPAFENQPDLTPDGPVRIGGVFRLAINKRPLLWLQTIHALRHNEGIDIRPSLFGSGPLAGEVAAEAAALGLDDLEIKSGITDPRELYGDLDVLLLMSQVEGLPNVLLEAQAMGKPVAACDVGGVRDAVKGGGKGAGLILDAQVSAADAAAQIAAWLPEVRKAPPYLVQRFVGQNFSTKQLGERTLQAYRGYRVTA